ncbi:MAG TPA: hypothetical protein VGM78_15635 [Ilumatobacteraceae bacterium]
MIAGLVTLAVIVATACSLGLIGPRSLTGAADNGDGGRLFCGAGLSPAAPASAWQGGVVLTFTRSPSCADTEPSSALPLLRLAVAGQSTFTLQRLGWLYSALAGVVSGAAAWALTVRRRVALALLAPIAVPVVDPAFARLFISTYAEPAGLLGAFSLMCGVVVVAATGRTDRRERIVALTLIAGGALAATAKVGYIPLLGVAVIAAATTTMTISARPRTSSIVGLGVAVLLALVSVVPIRHALAWQDRTYAEVNSYNLVYSMVLVEVPGTAAHLGLPAGAQDFAGNAYYPHGPGGVVGAAELAADPSGVRSKAWRLLLHHPFVSAHVVGIGLQATAGDDLTYLPSQPWAPGMVGPPVGVVISGEQGADAASLHSWLDTISVPWLPSATVALGLIAGACSLRRRRSLAAALARVAGAATLGALGIVVVAVLGDGYFEIAKHVWLAAYLLDVAQLALVLLAAVGVRRWWRRRRATDTASVEVGGPVLEVGGDGLDLVGATDE